ncbi:MAG TPA: imidazole glycerol phosphate synthase subunit HisH [Candidatus Sulfotelmatobacter sp.]|nr:imidazole glycerol phosphate synthase subunit HisH [Candidatus Sulfotelmatobacter sp.]
MIAIVDYGAGNLNSVRKAFDYLGAEVTVTSHSAAVAAADKIVLPGVGHFFALSALDRAGLRAAALEGIHAGKPFLGICLGMQWLFEGSEEAPDLPGAGLLSGRCRPFPAQVKSPHVGWNSLSPKASPPKQSRLLRHLPPDSFVYFTHSFHAPVTEHTSATTDYGLPFSSAIERNNIFGVQFHPEKSGSAGLQILRNFCEV